MNILKNSLLTQLRDKNTSRADFRRLANSLSHVLAQEIAEKLSTETVSCETPVTTTTGIQFSGSIVLVPILRSGIAMVPAFISYFPDARIGVMGLKRDEKTAQAHQYYANLPPLTADDQIIILDPMLATGGTAVQTIAALTEKGVSEKRIHFVGIVAAPEGEKAVRSAAPGVNLCIAARDEKLNDKKFIIPGLGDFGDRFFGAE